MTGALTFCSLFVLFIWAMHNDHKHEWWPQCRVRDWLSTQVASFWLYKSISLLVAVPLFFLTGPITYWPKLQKQRLDQRDKHLVLRARKVVRAAEVAQAAGQLSVIKKNAGGLSLSHKTNQRTSCTASNTEIS